MKWLKNAWTWLLKWRTHLFNFGAAVALMLPDILALIGSPEVKAVLPPHWQAWVALISLIGNSALRWRLASVKPKEPK